MATDVAGMNRIPSDWGLEVGSLAEVCRNYLPRRICQVDICKSIFRTLASDGMVFSDGLFKSLGVTYLRQAEDTLTKYEADATINGLAFDRHEEAKAVEAFSKAIAIAIALAAQAYPDNPMGSPLIPN